MQFFTHATPEIAVLENAIYITAPTATNVYTVTTPFLSASTDQAIFLLFLSPVQTSPMGCYLVAHLQTLRGVSDSSVTKVKNWHFEDFCSIPGFATDLFLVRWMNSVLYK